VVVPPVIPPVVPPVIPPVVATPCELTLKQRGTAPPKSALVFPSGAKWSALGAWDVTTKGSCTP
jgi:hypothetical protein